ncbi:MAG: hypothetical protein BWY83_02593 [bacterium ADurb.Bin478]|nr:MAG: hypothetical protein BWY83_02593 [bacterium ADurb.Bin478]
MKGVVKVEIDGVVVFIMRGEGQGGVVPGHRHVPDVARIFDVDVLKRVIVVDALGTEVAEIEISDVAVFVDKVEIIAVRGGRELAIVVLFGFDADVLKVIVLFAGNIVQADLQVIAHKRNPLTATIGRLHLIAAGRRAAVVRDFDRIEGLFDRIHFGVAVQILCALLQRLAAVDELRLPGEIMGQRPVPDFFRLVAPDLIGHQIGGTVEDAAVAVHAALVFAGIEVLAHLDRQGAHDIAVVRLSYVAQTAAGARLHDVLAHEPVIAIHHDAEKVGHGLVHGAGLVLIDEVGGILGHSVGQFMGHHIQAAGQGFEIVAAVSPKNRAAVPIGIVHRLAVFGHIDHRDDGGGGAVDRIPAMDIFIIGVGQAQIVHGGDRTAVRPIAGRAGLHVIIIRRLGGIGVLQIDHP